MLHPFYDALVWLAQPLLRRKLRRRGAAEPGYLHAVDERFGRYTCARPAGPGPLVWVHAVSLGETRAAAALIAALREALPGMRLLLTHGTATGRAEGQALLQAGDAQVWQPWDTRGAVRRFVAHFRPDIGVLMETEVWPNLTGEAVARGVPLVLANARLSARSLRGARRTGGLLRAAYGALSAALAQTEADAERLRAIGVRQVSVAGNLKFDATPDAAQLAQAARWRAALGGRPVVLLASARDGEEAEFFKHIRPLVEAGAAQRAMNSIDSPPPLWLVVPRHPQRFDAVAQLAVEAGFRVARRSAWAAEPPPAALAADLWIGDSLGEMALYYGLADAALLGGSFAPLGGQNLIEAAACGCPVLMGPHTFNFTQAAEGAVTAGAAERLPDMAAAVAAARALLADAARQAAMRRAGQDFALAHRGAAQRMAKAVAALLRPPLA